VKFNSTQDAEEIKEEQNLLDVVEGQSYSEFNPSE
jgi:hypothetical protein